ncbi:MAG: hypothetical protein HUJ27_01470 [Rhodobacteraceae bacterium]|nr:hypothetical protein [Paracoccaceae bacterium]
MVYPTPKLPIDTFKIEREAQALRSKAVAEGTKALMRWIAARLQASHKVGQAKAA